MLRLSVVVPVYNGSATIQRCLTALVSQQPAEVIVVDDGSTDATPKLAARFPARLLSTQGPGGPARARNLGAAAASGDLLTFIDADVEAHPDTLEKIRAAFETRPDLHALIGSYDDAPDDRSAISLFKNLLHHYVHQQAKTQASTFWGACGAVRRETYLRLGGMNETYDRPSIEDIEFGYRLRQAGLLCELRKDVQVKHLKRWTLRSLIRTDFLHRAIPWTQLMLRTNRFPADLNFSPTQKAATILAWLGIGGLMLTPFFPAALAATALSALAYLWLNRRLYRFLAERGGVRFLLAAIPLHFLYSAYCALGFVLGLGAHLLHTLTGTQPVFRSSLQTETEIAPST